MMQYTMFIFALLILVGLVWMEIRRPAKSFLLLRILATIAAVVALLLLVVPFQYATTNSDKNEMIVLSDGYNKDSVDQFLKNAHQSLPPLQLNHISSEQMEQVSRIHLFGNGFSDTNQVQLPNIPIVFHASDPKTGIQNIHWQETVVAGAPILVQGSCLNLSNKSSKLVLYGWNKRFDSIEIAAGREQEFSFSVIPVNEGRGLYHLSLIAGKDSLENETVAYQVLPAKAFKVLMLGESPDFEAKFLKNWLADFGYTVLSKTSISKGKYQKTFSNTGPSNFEKITAPLLDEQDLIISDEAAIQNLSATELALLKQAISEKGLGLILNADSVLSKTNFISDLFRIRSADSNKTMIQIRRMGENIETAPISMKHPFQILDQKGTQPLFIDQLRSVYASVATYGKGKLIVNTLQKTSSWLLSGNKNDYSYYWSTLMNRAAKKETALESWNIQTELPRVDDMVEVEASSSVGNSPGLTVQKIEVYTKQNNWLPSSWLANYWPMHPGWQTLVGTSGVHADWYAYPSNSWKAIYAKKQISQTNSYLKNRISVTTKKQPELPSKSKIPSIYLFLIFLCSMVFLWLERKFQ